MNKTILGIIIALIAVAGAIGVYYLVGDEEKAIKDDHVRFAEEYKEVEKNNIFVYKSLSEINNILSKGTGIIYLGFPECPWCQAYVPLLNEIAKENGINKIYYFNILNDRKENTETYQKTISILKDYLLLNDEGNPRVFVPDITFVKDGRIIAHDNETSIATEEDGTPQDYWTQEKKDKFKEKINSYIQKMNEKACTSCN